MAAWMSVCLTVLLSGMTSAASHPKEHLIRDPRQVELIQTLTAYDVITPHRVDADGNFLSHTLEHLLSPPEPHSRQGRSPVVVETPRYKVPVDGHDLHLHLTPNHHLFAPGLVVERRTHRTGNVSDTTIHRHHGNRCHFTGRVVGEAESKVSLATCEGLTGVLHTSKGDYFIEPVRGHNRSEDAGHPHILYSRASLPQKQQSSHAQHRNCAVNDNTEEQNKLRERWQKHHVHSSNPASPEERHHARRKRSTSIERQVETLVVVDHTMVEFYREDDLENYVLTIMNMVSTIFHDASLGNAVNIMLVRLILLEKEEPVLKISHHADNTLNSFCKWQQSMNPKDDTHPNHHDVAILLTRKDICSGMNEPCSTLGLAHVTGMCQPHRSCNINEDTGLALAYTVAHELGHNFGMQHDGYQNDCDVGTETHQHVMSPQITGDATTLIWSNCSRTYITRFLDRDWGFCLNDNPSEHEFSFPSLPPGVMYDADHQCRLQYGNEAMFCEGIDEVCTTLWCQVNNKCITRMDVTAHGTHCGQNKWCLSGHCVPIGEERIVINGNWGQWSDWSMCSRTCGAGVELSRRHCSNPPPSNGGQYCLGERTRYRICNTDACPESAPSFHQQQCSRFNDIPHQGKLYEWQPEIIQVTPCQLHCRPKGQFFSVMLQDAMDDGTPCQFGTRDMCIGGTCRHVGCDWVLDSKATEDHCGICLGDGSTCKTIRNHYNKTQGMGYEEAVVIPEGARNIRVEEVAEANNYLAVRDSHGESLLNGDWFIQWSGDYEAAGTVIHYERDGNKERVIAPGPIKEALHIMLLFQSQNPGVTFEYTVPTENSSEARTPEFFWSLEDWSHCTLSCGGGSQFSRAVCREREAGMVDDRYCNASLKPDDLLQSCNNHMCPARWWVGPWQHCSVSCGNHGTRKRTVICIRSLGPDEQIALENIHCSDLPQPESKKPCAEKSPCPEIEPTWVVGEWDKACSDDPCEVRTREVHCSVEGLCRYSTMPASTSRCSNVTCGVWVTGNWTKCTRSCGRGIQFRSATCVNGETCRRSALPEVQQDCNTQKCPRENIITQDTQTHMDISPPGDTEHTISDNENTIQTETHVPIKGSIELDKSKIFNMIETSIPLNLNSNKGSKTSSMFQSLLHNIGDDGNDVENNNVGVYEDTVDLDQYKWIPLFWKQCSRECGGGVRTRKVMCIHIETLKEVGGSVCSSLTRPATEEPCNLQPCGGTWWAGPWSECSRSCGSGEQVRHTQCVDPATRQPAASCPAEAQPVTSRTCQNQPCPQNAALEQREEFLCESDIISSQLCKSLRKVGQCQNRYIQLKCCRTCHEQRQTDDVLDPTS